MVDPEVRRTPAAGHDRERSASGTTWIRAFWRSLRRVRPPRKEMGSYRILRYLDEGGMTDVYVGEIVGLGKRVAIKFLQDKFIADPRQRQRFERSARIAALMSHPAITQIHYSGDWDGRPCIIEEFVEGVDLRKWGREHSGMPPEIALLLLRDLCSAVQHMHDRGVIHRDLKPANVMFTTEGAIKLMDFGIARRELETADVTQYGDAPGTIPYMSPEQIQGRTLEVGRPSDVWAVGVISYELLTGERPFTGSDTREIAHQILTRDPPALMVLNPNLPERLSTTVAQMLQKDADRRLRSARFALEAMETALADLGIQRQLSLLQRYAADPDGVKRELEASRRERMIEASRSHASGLAGGGAALSEVSTESVPPSSATIVLPPPGPTRPAAGPGAAAEAGSPRPPGQPSAPEPPPTRWAPPVPAPVRRPSRWRRAWLAIPIVMVVIAGGWLAGKARQGGDSTIAQAPQDSLPSPRNPLPGPRIPVAVPDTTGAAPAHPAAAVPESARAPSASPRPRPAPPAPAPVARNRDTSNAVAHEPTAVLGLRTGTVTIEVMPAATLFLGDTVVATHATHKDLTLSVGRYTIRAQARGYPDQVWEAVDVAAGRTTALSYDFTRAMGFLRARSTNDFWGMVTVEEINGTYRKTQTSREIFRLRPGSYRVVIEKEGLILGESPGIVRVSAGDTLIVPFTLHRR